MGIQSAFSARNVFFDCQDATCSCNWSETFKVVKQKRPQGLVRAFANQTDKNQFANEMKYTDSKGNEIENISDWERLVFKSTKKKKHWKAGRSAYSIADFMMNGNGEPLIKAITSELLKEDISFEKAIPELEVRFDDYGHGREHDLGIWGITDSKKKVFIGIEAKVDEPFGRTISEAYTSATIKKLNSKNKDTNAPKRIEELLKKHFKKIKPEHFNLRYQLFYSTVGTLAARADISILLIIVFKTNLYNEIIGLENYQDYIIYVNSIESERIGSKPDKDIHKFKIGGELMYSIYMNIDMK